MKRVQLAAIGAAGFLMTALPVAGQTLSGNAVLGPDTFAPGPTSGQFITPNVNNGRPSPFVGQQPVQGFSAILPDGSGGWLVMTDNGFGSKANSADSVLRFHDVSIDLKRPGGAGTGAVTYQGNVTLSDPNHKIAFPIVADGINYPNSAIPVDPAIRNGRLLTGADFDLESFRRAPDGTLYFGEEFGPFVLHASASGVLLDAPVPLPGVQSPDNPLLGGNTPNLSSSRGFEGMAQNGTKLYTMLEGPTGATATDRANGTKLQINEFDTTTGAYTNRTLFYPLSGTGANRHIGDFTEIGNDKYVVLEKDFADGVNAVFNHVFLVDLNVTLPDGTLVKRDLADLLNISDPDQIGIFGDSVPGTYRFPYVTVESVILTAPDRLLIANDNNYPFSNGRTPGTPDSNEFIELQFGQALNTLTVPEPGAVGAACAASAAALLRRRRRRATCGAAGCAAVAAIVAATAPRSALAALPNGVASGDTTANSTVLWGRTDTPGTVTFEYSTDPTFAGVLGTGNVVVTDPMIPAKLDVASGLAPGTRYYYRATDSTAASASGTFITPALNGHGGFHLGVSGDWRGELAPYPSIRNVPAKNLDVFLKFGDTIYADVPSPAFSAPQAQTLDEYRIKHNEVQSTVPGATINSFRDLNQSTSVLAVIDDHEVTNDFAGYATVADYQAAGDTRFDFGSPAPATRINRTPLFNNGVQAFHEYMPIRQPTWSLPLADASADRMNGVADQYRSRTYGSDAAVIVSDARSFRDKELPPVTNPTDGTQVNNFLVQSFNPARTMLGKPQLARLESDLMTAQDAGVTWKFVNVPEPIQNLGVVAASDRYEGYAAERSQLLSFINGNNPQGKKIDNVVFVTADIHGTVVNNLTYQNGPGQPQIKTAAFEISTGAVAYDAPFGPTVITLGHSLGAIDDATFATYNNPATPASVREAILQAVVNAQLTPLGYTPIGIEADSGINASLTVGTWTATSSYGWTEFQVDPLTQALTVTTWGIPYYQEAGATQYAGLPFENLSPQIVQQFVVMPVPEPAAAATTLVIAVAASRRRTTRNPQPQEEK